MKYPKKYAGLNINYRKREKYWRYLKAEQFFFLNQQHENVTESGIEPETFPFLEGRSTIGAISVRFSDSHIPTLYSLVLHPTLRTADLKDEKEYSSSTELI